MRLFAAVLLLAPLCCSVAGPTSRAAEEKRLEGTWVVTSTLNGDKDRGEGEFQGATFTFKDKQLVITTRDGKDHKGEVVLGAAEGGAREIDFTWGGKAVKGLYSLRSTGLVLCFDRTGKTRPSSLKASTVAPSLVLLTLEPRKEEEKK